MKAENFLDLMKDMNHKLSKYEEICTYICCGEVTEPLAKTDS